MRNRTPSVSTGFLWRALLLFACFAMPLAVHGQSSSKVPRIGFLASGTTDANQIMVDAFREGMQELGWIEGKNVTIDYRFAEGQFERLPGLASELVRNKVDVILATPTPAVFAARDATKSIPIVMASVADPVAQGLIASFAKPGGNVTGTAFSASFDIYAKQLQLLKEAVPAVKRVAVLTNPGNPGHKTALRNIRAAAQSLDLSLQIVEARTPGDFESAFAEMNKRGAQAVLTISDSMFGSNALILGKLATAHRLPSMLGARMNVEPGGLMLFGPNIPLQVRRAALYVDKILKGAKPGELPVEQPTTFQLVINQRTARAIGVTIPPSLLQRADQVIE
ncbi:MAG TPA: ABC transporter substrate-binding protein [Casimicrobiaceae bacterium]|nr:ABC transporter substrate-binding protein [Casimicrobiaceae bacterium]